MRGRRKFDHLRLAQALEDGPGDTGFGDIHFVHNCLPELDSREINTECSFCGRVISVPLIINAITGGIEEGKMVNRALARAARQLSLPMAVGSQTAALEEIEVSSSFQIAREENPDGFLMANLSASASVQKALQAIEMIRADALQLHLNVPQEVMMPSGEGDSSFKGILENIRQIARSVPVPVIVKETGFGMAREEVLRLLGQGIAALGIDGKGGTNFVKIEGERQWKGFQGQKKAASLLDWGLPTAVSLIEAAEAVASAGAQKVGIIAAGGVRSGLDIAKSLSLGAAAAAVAGPLVKCYYKGGEEAIIIYLSGLIKELRQAMLMLGAKDIFQLQQRPLVILGDTCKWLEQRGITIERFTRRG